MATTVYYTSPMSTLTRVDVPLDDEVWIGLTKYPGTERYATVITTYWDTASYTDPSFESIPITHLSCYVYEIDDTVKGNCTADKFAIYDGRTSFIDDQAFTTAETDSLEGASPVTTTLPTKTTKTSTGDHPTPSSSGNVPPPTRSSSSSVISQTPTSSSTPGPTASTTAVAPSSGVPTATIAGAVTGTSIFMLVAVPLAFFVIRRKRRKHRQDSGIDTSSTPDTARATGPGSASLGMVEPKYELHATPRDISQLGSPLQEPPVYQLPPPHETSDPCTVHTRPVELTNDTARYEMYDDARRDHGVYRVHHELEGGRPVRLARDPELWFRA